MTEGKSHTRPAENGSRLSAGGKFLRAGRHATVLRGVTYGTFRPGPDGAPYPAPGVVECDFAAMAATGFNAVRTYTVPPRWLLDLASHHGLHVMAGIAWEQHVAVLDESRRARAVLDDARRQIEPCAGHPALACVAAGNEIPAPIVRWHGPRRIEDFVARLCHEIASEDPDVPQTYVNYPSTEYLDLPFLDVVSFNVFLEDPSEFDDYVARLQCIAGDRPLVLAEIGLDRRTHGERRQRRLLEAQVESVLAGGAAGLFVFSWTDEWHRGGHDVTEWQFGLTDAERRPTEALGYLAAATRREPPETVPATVVVCTYNGAATLGDCLDGIAELDYPALEVIVVDDGSTDGSAAIAARRGVRVISTENRGLSAARNTGTAAANGDVVAFVDDDAVPDPSWLRQAVGTLSGGLHVGVGGPNIPPQSVSVVEQAVACAPGGPTHVLLSDRLAEHIPGCNMVFWRDALVAVGGFDDRFRIAGDDVDICWRLQGQGWSLGFSPGAMVWHRRRGTVRSYLRQQFQYGRAEALLERKWPEKYNRGGHLAWAGRVYASHSAPGGRRRRKVLYGSWGRNLFQTAVERPPSFPGLLPLMPEWFLVIGAFLLLLLYETIVRPPLLVAAGAPVPVATLLLALSFGALWLNAGRAAWRAVHDRPLRQQPGPAVVALTATLYVAQPLARLAGRLRHGLTPWRRRGRLRSGSLRAVTVAVWTERGRPLTDHLAAVEAHLRPDCMHVTRGGETDRWDLQARVGPLGAARLRATVEEHGDGCQLLRFRLWPRWAPFAGMAAGTFALGALAAARVGDVLTGGLLLCVVGVLVLRALREAGAAADVLREAASAAPAHRAPVSVPVPAPEIEERQFVTSRIANA